jgi:hypothetical protein
MESASLTKKASLLEDVHLKLVTLMEGYLSGPEDEEEDENKAGDLRAEALQVKHVT